MPSRKKNHTRRTPRAVDTSKGPAPRANTAIRTPHQEALRKNESPKRKTKSTKTKTTNTTTSLPQELIPEAGTRPAFNEKAERERAWSPPTSLALPHLTHVDSKGRVQMVDVSHKPQTTRVAVAQALLRCSPSTREALLSSSTKKGESIATAKIAGVLAAKQTSLLLPLCHPVPLTDIAIAISGVDDGVRIEARATCVDRTGVEMEAMMAAAVAGLALYDMGKAAERGMILDEVSLVEKTGGRSGVWRRNGAGRRHST
jgi:cyclic pyranopterin phosphate synthase